MAIDPQSLDLLIRTMYGEAAGESPQGQAAVAHVILNRTRQPGYGGSSVRDVVMAPKQFEPWGNPDARRRMLSLDPSSPKYQELARIALGVAEGTIPDPTGGATHFANEAIVRQRRGGAVAPWMAKMADTAQTIGNHTFYGGGGLRAPVDPSGLPAPDQPPPPPEWAQQFPSQPPAPAPAPAAEIPTEEPVAGLLERASGGRLEGILGMLAQQQEAAEAQKQAALQANMQATQAAIARRAQPATPPLLSLLGGWPGLG